MNESQISNNKEKIIAILKKLEKVAGRKPGTQERVGLSDRVDVKVFHTQLNEGRLNKWNKI